MPRWASRLTLTVSDVRVQRLTDITETDALAEGVQCCGMCRDANGLPDWLGYHVPGVPMTTQSSPIGAFASLWHSIHGADDWNFYNPWIVAISFAVEHGNIDALPKKELAA
jgi:hypothetical protein